MRLRSPMSRAIDAYPTSWPAPSRIGEREIDDVDGRAILAQLHRVEAQDALARLDPFADVLGLVGALGGVENRDGASDHLFGGVAVDFGRARVPARDDAVEARPDDGVVRGLHEGRHPVERDLPPQALADVDRNGTDERCPGLAAQGELQDEPVAVAGRGRKQLFDLDDGAARKDGAVVLVNAFGHLGRKPLGVGLADQGSAARAKDAFERLIAVDEPAGLILQEFQGRAVVAQQSGLGRIIRHPPRGPGNRMFRVWANHLLPPLLENQSCPCPDLIQVPCQPEKVSGFCSLEKNAPIYGHSASPEIDRNRPAAAKDGRQSLTGRVTR